METNGVTIRRLRLQMGHGLNRFAAIAGISGPALSRIENGLRKPRPETLKKITLALGCDVKDVATLPNRTNSGAAAGATATAPSEQTTHPA